MQEVTQKVQDIVEIINGELINSPAIGGFSGYCTKLENIKRGSLFFAAHPRDIEPALEKGAFGIVFDKFLQTRLNDDEIAWVKVESIQDAIIRLARFELLARSIRVIATNPTQYLIAKSLIHSKSVLFFDESPIDLLDVVEEVRPAIIIAKSQQVLDLALEPIPCETPEQLPFELITPMSMFEIKFYYKLYSYKISLPCVFVPELAAVVDLCLREHIECDFAHFEPSSTLLPISLTNDARILSFGQSSRVIIPTNDEEIFMRHGEFLSKEAKWAKVVVFVPTILDDEQGFYALYNQRNNHPLQAIRYDSSNELPLLLKTTEYNFGLIFGISTQGLVFVLSQTPQEYAPTLF